MSSCPNCAPSHKLEGNRMALAALTVFDYARPIKATAIPSHGRTSPQIVSTATFCENAIRKRCLAAAAWLTHRRLATSTKDKSPVIGATCRRPRWQSGQKHLEPRGLRTRRARQRDQVVQELRQEYPLAGLLKAASLARSSFYYLLKLVQLSDKHARLKSRIRSIFQRHRAGMAIDELQLSSCENDPSSITKLFSGYWVSWSSSPLSA